MTESSILHGRPHGPSNGLIRVFYALALGTLAFYIAWIGANVLIPLVIAVFLTFLIVTLKNVIRSAPAIGPHIPNWLGFIVAFFAIAGAFMFLIDIVGDNFADLLARRPEYESKLNEIAERIRAFLQERGVEIDEDADALQVFARDALQNVRIGALVEPIRSLTGNAVTILLYTGFLLLERGSFFKKVTAMSTDRGQAEAVFDIIDHVGGLIRQYISIKTFASALVATLTYIILKIANVDFAGFWAILTFVLNFIPIVGSIVAVAFPIILATLQFENPYAVIGLIVALTGAQQVVGSVIEPRLLGESLNLSPLMILLSLAVWGSLWGIAGMLLCVPIMVVVGITLSQFAATRPVAILMSQDGQVAQINRTLAPSAE